MPHRDGKTAVAVDGAQVEEDIDGQQILRVGAPDPVVDPVPPRCDRASPGRVFRHDATPAIGHSGLMQDVSDMGPERRKPAILRAVRLAALEDHGIVLVHRQQAFAAPCRSEHDHGIAAWRVALAALSHDPLGNHGGLPGQRAEFAGNHFRNVAAGQPFRQQGFRDPRQLGPGNRQGVRVRRIVDLVAERDGLSGAQAKQVARGQGADHAAGLVDDGKVAGLETVHAADRAVDESVGRNRGERPAHDLPDRQIERGGTMPRDRAQQVALRDNARLRRLDAAGNGMRPDIHRRYSLARQPREGIVDRNVGLNKHRRHPHDVTVAMPIGVAVEAFQGRFRVGARREPRRPRSSRCAPDRRARK